MLSLVTTTSIALAATQVASPAPSTAKATSSISLHLSARNPMVGQAVRLHGRVLPGGRQTVLLFSGGGGSLRTVTDSHGSFSVRWRPPQPGIYRIRAYLRANQLTGSGRSPVRRLTAFRLALASYYGPGFYGGGLACGGTLGPGTIGVANRTLPCGATLTLRYGNRSLQVRVIDRGPYSGGREFDLTAATKQRLNFPSTGYILSSR